MDKRTPNDLNAAVPKFCLALEEFRRTADGRVRTSQEFLQQFFPHDQNKATDRLFKYTPNEVRGPILTTWGLRGAKSALKDTDEKVQSVVWDALLAGDIDHEAFESAVTADILVKWAPLTEWWTFWRAGKLSKLAIHKALDSAYELGLFDAKWFFDTIEGTGGKLKGTDVVSEGLTKAELTEWVRKVHASGDGSPKGMLAAIGWDRVVGKTPNDVLIKVIDAVAQRIALVAAPKKEEKKDESVPEVDERPSTRMTPVPAAPVDSSDADDTSMMKAIPLDKPVKHGGQNEDERALDALFQDSQAPGPNDEGILVVEDEISETNASPTNRPPANDEPTLMKARPQSMPASPPSKIPARR